MTETLTGVPKHPALPADSLHPISEDVANTKWPVSVGQLVFVFKILQQCSLVLHFTDSATMIYGPFSFQRIAKQRFTGDFL